MESYPEHYPNQTTKYTFNCINRYLSEKMVYIDLSKDLIGKNGCYTDFARMISDQCPWHLDYQDENERVVFDGPLPIQVESCISKIAERNPLLADGGRKGVYRRFPSVAVREALVNAVIHFDSSYDVDIEITMSKNDLRIESPGGIYPCCESDSIQVRNQCIAVLFRQLRYANLTSRGLIAIRNSYVNSGKKPRFASTSDSFVVNLPSIGSGKSDMDQTRKMVHDYL